jgi:hypothetical protein
MQTDGNGHKRPLEPGGCVGEQHQGHRAAGRGLQELRSRQTWRVGRVSQKHQLEVDYKAILGSSWSWKGS